MADQTGVSTVNVLLNSPLWRKECIKAPLSLNPPPPLPSLSLHNQNKKRQTDQYYRYIFTVPLWAQIYKQYSLALGFGGNITGAGTKK